MMTKQLVTNEITDHKFFESGFAVFTVSNPDGERYTFQIKRARKDSGPWFVSVLRGPENNSDKNYSYIGCYVPQQHQMVLTKNSKYTANSKPFKVFNWAVQAVFLLDTQGRPIPEGYKIQHNGKCCACGRMLTTPESIEKGIGPVCLAARDGI